MNPTAPIERICGYKNRHREACLLWEGPHFACSGEWKVGTVSHDFLGEQKVIQAQTLNTCFSKVVLIEFKKPG